MKLYFTLLLLGYSLCQCSARNEGFDEIAEEVSSVSAIEGLKAVVIIPSQGCDGCITTVEDFMLKKYASLNGKGVLFIVTGHNSVKSAALRLGGFIRNNKYIYIDTKHQFDSRLFIAEYPRVFFFQDKKVVRFSELSPKTSNAVYKELSDLI